MAPSRILVVDDDPQVLPVLQQLLAAHQLEAEVFSDPFELLESVQERDIGCVVTDLEMPGLTGIEVQSRLIEMGSCLAVVVVTGHADVPRTIQIMAQGAVTLLEKPFKSAQLIHAVEKAIAISQQTFVRREKIRSAVQRISSLSQDELEIMKLAAAGVPNKTISYQLDVSPRTIDRRRQSAMNKLHVASVADFAVLLATSQEEFN